MVRQLLSLKIPLKKGLDPRQSHPYLSFQTLFENVFKAFTEGSHWRAGGVEPLTGKISSRKIIALGNQNVSSVRCHFSKINLTWPIKVVGKSKPSER